MTVVSSKAQENLRRRSYFAYLHTYAVTHVECKTHDFHVVFASRAKGRVSSIRFLTWYPVHAARISVETSRNVVPEYPLTKASLARLYDKSISKRLLNCKIVYGLINYAQ